LLEVGYIRFLFHWTCRTFDINTGHPSEILVNIQAVKGKEEENSEDASDRQELSDDDEEKDGKLVGEEEKETGVVKMSVYKAYWKAVGNLIAPIVLCSLLLMQGTYHCFYTKYIIITIVMILNILIYSQTCLNCHLDLAVTCLQRSVLGPPNIIH